MLALARYAFCAAALFITVSVLAQSTTTNQAVTGAIKGRITTGGQPVPGITLTLMPDFTRNYPLRQLQLLRGGSMARYSNRPIDHHQADDDSRLALNMIETLLPPTPAFVDSMTRPRE